MRRTPNMTTVTEGERRYRNRHHPRPQWLTREVARPLGQLIPPYSSASGAPCGQHSQQACKACKARGHRPETWLVWHAGALAQDLNINQAKGAHDNRR